MSRVKEFLLALHRVTRHPGDGIPREHAARVKHLNNSFVVIKMVHTKFCTIWDQDLRLQNMGHLRQLTWFLYLVASSTSEDSTYEPAITFVAESCCDSLNVVENIALLVDTVYFVLQNGGQADAFHVPEGMCYAFGPLSRLFVSSNNVPQTEFRRLVVRWGCSQVLRVWLD